MAVSHNSLAGFLAVYAQKSLTAFLADMPARDMFTENFDDTIAAGGVSVTTRIPTTVYGSMNDLGTSGWESQQATASAVTITLATKGHDHSFNVTEWSTITPSMLEQLYFPVIAKQTANGVVCEALSNVTSSVYLTASYTGIGSGFSLAGATGSLQECAKILDTNEIPSNDRYCILSPASWQKLISGMYQTYVYGDPTVIRQNGYSGASTNVGLSVAGFNTFRYARMPGASRPYGGSIVAPGGTDNLLGIAGHKQGLVMACRTPIPMNTGLIQSYEAVDPSSKLSIQVILAFDQSVPVWRIGTYILYGTARGNPRAIVPILTAVA